VRDEEEEKKGRRAQEKIKLKLEDKIVPGLILGWTDWLDSSSPSINSKQQASDKKWKYSSSKEQAQNSIHEYKSNSCW